MIQNLKDKPFLQAIRGKVIAAALLACVAIVLALAITYFSFRGLLTTVDELSSPNEKLRTLNIFFQRVTQLDQQQRADAINHPLKPFENFLQESKSLLLTLDTLRAMDWHDPHQIQRIDSMESIIIKRDQLFLSYLKIKSDFIYNRNFKHRLDTLSGILSDSHNWNDTSVTSTQRKTTTTTYVPDASDKAKDKRPFLKRLFSKKKDTIPSETRVEILEELSVRIDTLTVAQQDSAIEEVGRIMKSLEKDQRQQKKNMMYGELELINTNTILINQLLGILHQVEAEEHLLMNQNNKAAVQLVNTSILRIGLIILIFFLGAALLVFLILADIVRSNFYKDQLIKAKEEAEQLGQVKQRFLANMSHEIRTPLQSILGFTEQLKQTSSSDQEALNAIHTSSEHLLHIVNEVLDYSRMESGKFTLEHVPFQLLEVMEEVSSGIRMQAQQRGLSFMQEVNVSSDMLLLGDSFRLRQILYNLLGNAVKFTTEGFVKLIVEADASGSAVQCKIQVIDSGIGMNPEDMERVFRQFEQANASINHQYGGTGLGLTIVKSLVELQHGKLHVESVPGKGSVFTVELTFDNVTGSVQKEAGTKVRIVNSSFEGKVMVVDDDPMILRLCSLILEKHHIRHVTFSDPAMALQQDVNDVQLILLDIRMPGMNGIELCHELRKKIKHDLRIVALTAHVLPQEHAGLLEEGFDEILTKPFREQRLLDVIGVSSTNPTETGDDMPIDFSALRKMTMGDEALFQSIVAQFIEETTHDVKTLETKLEAQAPEEVREIIHKLAGRTGQMGISELSLVLKAIEQDLVDGKSIVQEQSAIVAAKDAMHAVLEEMRQIIIVTH